MKILLSRKGFDSTEKKKFDKSSGKEIFISNGGVASPILPDERMRSLPIPENSKNSCVTFEQIYKCDKEKYPTGEIVESLTKNKRVKILKETLAHFDPDIDINSRARDKNWRGIFGQSGGAQTYLKDKIGKGDLFLFFGWFKKTIGDDVKKFEI